MLEFTNADYVQDAKGLLQQFSTKLDAFEDLNQHANTGAWTKAVQTSLKELAAQFDSRIEHLSSPKTTTNGTGEFLLDAVWYRRIERGVTEHIALAVESEFAGYARDRESVAAEVLKDFSKLLVIKSPLKLMVFCSWYGPGDKKESLEKMRAGIWLFLKQALVEYSHHIQGEKYLFFDTAVKGERTAWIVTIPQSGSLTSELLIEDSVSLATAQV